MWEGQWPTEWLRGILPLCILAVVAEGRTYGYAVGQRLQAGGLGTIKGGTIYPVLARLEQDGHVTSGWGRGEAGPGRKYFSVTATGRVLLEERTREWATFTQRAAALLSHQGAGT
ncbi:MAG: PadR family transcriptional regulator [Acidimicrobiales bacterium]